MDQAPVGIKREIIATLAVLIVIVAIVSAVAVANKEPKPTPASVATTPAATATTPMPAATDTVTPAANTSTYKDGDYSATGSYDSPGGQEKITIKVTLRSDTVTATSATSGAGDPEAREYQSDFIASYKTQVVGQKISSLSLSRVAGSSLTSQGFNDAIQQIKNQAKV